MTAQHAEKIGNRRCNFERRKLDHRRNAYSSLKSLTEEPGSLAQKPEARQSKIATSRGKSDQLKAAKIAKLTALLRFKKELKKEIVLSDQSERSGSDSSSILNCYSEDGIYLERRRGQPYPGKESRQSGEGLYYLPDSNRFVTLQNVKGAMRVSDADVSKLTIEDIDAIISMFEPKPAQTQGEISQKAAKPRPAARAPVQSLKDRLMDKKNPEATPLIKKIVRFPRAAVEKMFDEAANM